MAKCKCCSKPRIVSNVVQSINQNDDCCVDVCANTICADPSILGLYAPLIYDEVGINLCTTFTMVTDISDKFPTATNATVKLIDVTYTNGAGNVTIDQIPGRKNCYVITLSNINLVFAIDLYDSSCKYLGTISETALYLPSSTAAPTYDEDTNPSSVELVIYAPYGLDVNNTGTTPSYVINVVGNTNLNNTMKQGVNLFGMAKILDLDITANTVTVGVTLVLQSMYYAGYKVKSAGKIDIPKGSIITPENTDCMKFVAGDLLNLAIKPLDFGSPYHEEFAKVECCNNSCNSCVTTKECNNAYNNNCSNNVADVNNTLV